MNKFKFWGVGQGLFYTGSLMHGTYNFVFDCGSKSREFYLKKQINEYIYEWRANRATKPHIDFVVISHLHADHINGIYDLLTNCKVDKLYLPYLMGDEVFKKFALAYISFYDFIGDEEGINNGIYNSEENYNENIERCRVLYDTLKSFYGISESEPHFDTQVVIVGEENPVKPIEFNVGNNYDPYWEFKIFHRNLDKKIICDLNLEIIALMQSCGYTSFNDEDIINFVLTSNDKINELAKKYDEIFGKKNKYGLNGGMNISSLVLVHYPLYSASRAFYPEKAVHNVEYEYYCGLKYGCRCTDLLGEYNFDKKITLLTGDALLDGKFTQFWEFIKDEGNRNNILFLQVPHHGSWNNWAYLKKISAVGYVISFGLGNGHGHPHPQTIYDLKDKLYFCVTQEQSFEYIFD